MIAISPLSAAINPIERNEDGSVIDDWINFLRYALQGIQNECHLLTNYPYQVGTFRT